MFSPIGEAKDTSVTLRPATSTGNDRRRRLRFALNADLTYQSLEKSEVTVSGQGQVHDISSGALAFHADGAVPVK